MNEEASRDAPFSARLGAFFGHLRDYLNLGPRRDREPLTDGVALRRFLETRSSYVAQTSLYGYLRTRAGMRYPELFDDDTFVASINIAKWHVWLACLSDLCVYTGSRLLHGSTAGRDDVEQCMQVLLQEILAATGVPQEAGGEFAAHAERVTLRLAGCDLARIGDDESAFTESPNALVRYAPIVDTLKELDAGIVRNSVRFRWQEVRRDLRRNLDADRVMASRRPGSAAR
jgi:hypothetical protein